MVEKEEWRKQWRTRHGPSQSSSTVQPFATQYSQVVQATGYQTAHQNPIFLRNAQGDGDADPTGFLGPAMSLVDRYTSSKYT